MHILILPGQDPTQKESFGYAVVTLSFKPKSSRPFRIGESHHDHVHCLPPSRKIIFEAFLRRIQV
jgi:hypothetical protein